MSSPEHTVGTVARDVLPLIAGRELLIAHLGHWPTFHDFEVLSVTLERASWDLTCTRDLRAIFFVFDLQKPPGDAQRREGSAEILFESVDAVEISGWNHQNPIMGLSITASSSDAQSRQLHVSWGGTCMPHEVSFTCRLVSVLRVIDLNPFRKPHAPA